MYQYHQEKISNTLKWTQHFTSFPIHHSQPLYSMLYDLYS